MATVGQREAVLKRDAQRYKGKIREARESVIQSFMNEPLDVPGLGSVYLHLSNDHRTIHADSTIQILDNFENQLADGFNNNNVLKIDAHSDIISYYHFADYYTHLNIKTRESIQRILKTWKIKRSNIETQSYIWGESYKERIDKIDGVIPVTNSEGKTLTGIPSLVERERIKAELDNEMIQQNARGDILAVVIPSGLSDDRIEASQQAIEWLITIAQQKSNWLINAIDEVYAPGQLANHEQENALKTIEVERQKGVLAIQRATTKTTIQTAYDTAKTAINNVSVVNAPVWKMDTGATIPLTDGFHVIPYTEVGGSVTYRADNLVIDEEDSVGMGDVAIDKINVTDPLSITYQAASGTIGASYAVTITFGGTKHPPIGNYDVEITARNTYGPSLLKVRFVVPNFQPTFPRPSLPDKNIIFPTEVNIVDEVIQFDEAIGGNGKLTYSISPLVNGSPFYSYPRTREQRIFAGSTRAREIHTITATDEDGDTATQTIAVTIM